VSGRDHVLETTTSTACLDEVHELLRRLWDEAPGVAAADRVAFETAVAEIAANIVEHAAAGAELPFRLVVAADDHRVEARFEDAGAAYDTTTAESGVVDAGAERGRGLGMARALSDELVYDRAGDVNRWVLRRRLRT
jgi:serine/threonine-protein kinase RsbW